MACSECSILVAVDSATRLIFMYLLEEITENTLNFSQFKSLSVTYLVTRKMLHISDEKMFLFFVHYRR